MENFKVITGSESGATEISPFEDYDSAKAHYEEVKHDDFYAALIKVNEDESETVLEETRNE
jgi:hypothetical protein